MARILSDVTLSVPAGSASKNVNDTFTMTQQYATTGTGGSPDCTLHWRYDQGTGTWIDIPTSGSTGLTADAGNQTGAARITDYSRTITCKSAGVFVIRAWAHDITNSIDKYSSNTPTMTVSAAAGPALLKTVNGLAVASVKTLRSGLAIASGKTFNGLA